MVKGLYEPIILKGDILHYYKSFTELLKGHFKLVSEAYRTNLSLDREQMYHDLQLGDYAYWKRRHLKDSLKPRWKGPYLVFLTSSCAAKLKGVDPWTHISHLRRAPARDRSIEKTFDLKLTLK